jgi:hypothetical protein
MTTTDNRAIRALRSREDGGPLFTSGGVSRRDSCRYGDCSVPQRRTLPTIVRIRGAPQCPHSLAGTRAAPPHSPKRGRGRCLSPSQSPRRTSGTVGSRPARRTPPGTHAGSSRACRTESGSLRRARGATASPDQARRYRAPPTDGAAARSRPTTRKVGGVCAPGGPEIADVLQEVTSVCADLSELSPEVPPAAHDCTPSARAARAGIATRAFDRAPHSARQSSSVGNT